MKTRYIPTGYTEYKPEIGDYPKDLFAVYVDLEKVSAIFYTGKQANHTWYNRFRTVEEMKKKINDTIARLMAWEDRKLERKEERKAPTGYKIGDIFYSSWGYDQTNVNFYKVVGVKGKQTLELREIGSKVVSSDGGPSTHVIADEERFIGEKVYTRRASGKYINISECQTGYPWDGKPQYETALGWGH